MTGRPKARQAAALNREVAYARKVAAVSTPVQRTAVAFDRWRGLVAKLPADQARLWADVITKALDEHSQRLTQVIHPDRE